jgi:hypothetical protein
MNRLYILFFVICFSVNAQVITDDKKIDNKITRKYKLKTFLDKTYKSIFKYGTLYIAGDARNSYLQQRKDYFIRTDPNDLYAVPEVIDETIYFPFDYRYGLGLRRLARYDYEVKQNYIDGTENMIGLSAPTGAVSGFEYLFHFEKERRRGDVFINSRYFLRHTGKHHIIKLEHREQGNVDFKYQSAELRLRLPISKKLSISAGLIARTHQKAYGYVPIEIWLNETTTFVDGEGNEIEYPVNAWYSLGYLYGYTDEPTTYTNESTGESFFDWIWRNPQGEIVAYGDRDFRDRVYGQLMNRYNNEIWDTLQPYAKVAPILGFDFYHYKNKFWLHSYANWILPHHYYFKGDSDFNYLNRNNWGKGGLREDSTPEQWSDYQAGIITGWRISKTLGIFLEGEYTKFWDSELYRTSFGINLKL